MWVGDFILGAEMWRSAQADAVQLLLSEQPLWTATSGSQNVHGAVIGHELGQLSASNCQPMRQESGRQRAACWSEPMRRVVPPPPVVASSSAEGDKDEELKVTAQFDERQRQRRGNISD